MEFSINFFFVFKVMPSLLLFILRVPAPPNFLVSGFSVWILRVHWIDLSRP